MKSKIVKSIKILDSLIISHKNRSDGMKKLCISWSEDSRLKRLALAIASIDEDVIKCLQLVKDQLVEKPQRNKIGKKTSK